MLKSIFESELIDSMQNVLIKQANNQDLTNVEQAVDYLNNAIEIFEDFGLNSKADKILNVLYKIASKKDPYTENLTTKDMIKNLKQHGTEFPLLDLNKSDDILNVDMDVDVDVNNIKSDDDFLNFIKNDKSWEDKSWED